VTSSSSNMWSSTSAGASQTALTTVTAASHSSSNLLFSAGAPAGGLIDTPVLSPDGTKIAFTSKLAISGHASPLSYNLWIMNANGTGQANLTATWSAGYDCYNPVFSADGSTIYFSSTMGSGAASGSWNGGASSSSNIWSV